MMMMMITYDNEGDVCACVIVCDTVCAGGGMKVRTKV